MADEKRGPTAAPGGKRRRPAPTIDLRATEITSEPVNPTEPVDPPAETPRADAPPIAPGEPEAPKAEPRESDAAASASSRGWRPEWLDLAAMTNRMSAWRDRATQWLNWRLIGAGAAAMLALFALWVLGAANPRDDLTVTLAARLAIVELQVRDLALRPQPAGLDQRLLTDLAARVGAGEQAMGRLNDFDTRIARAEATAAAPRPAPPPDQALTGRVAALEAAQKAPPPPPVVAHSEIEALAARVGALEQAAKSAEEKIARAAVTAGADRAGRLAFVAVTLRQAVERGEPFARELAAAKPLVSNAAALAALEPFAASGVPRAAALARELSALTGAMLGAAGNAPRDGGFIDRLQQNAERLVRVRPISEAPGDDAAAVIARAEVKAAHGDITGSLSELAQLPAAARAPAQAWIKKAEAQMAALAAARGIAESAIGALAAP